jgi:hypothetical protein
MFSKFYFGNKLPEKLKNAEIKSRPAICDIVCLCFLFGAEGGGGCGIHMYVTRLRAGRSGVESREGYRFPLLTSRLALGLNDRVFNALHGSSSGIEAVGG